MFGNYSLRRELFPLKEKQPDYDCSLKVTKPNIDRGVPDFRRYVSRKTNDFVKPYKMPDGYDT